MKIYRVTIEAFGRYKTVDFEAATPEDAEEIGKDIFFEECNYGVSEIESGQEEASE